MPNPARHGDRPPLDGIAVVELAEWIAGPFLGKLLADLGADVLKVETSAGDPTRRWGPFGGDRAGDPDRSGQFAYLNTGKRVSTVPAHVDPSALDATAHELTVQADVLVVDDHFLRRLPSDFVDRLAEHRPSLVIVAVTPYGLDGPKARELAYDINASARGGVAYGVGRRGEAPLPLPRNQTEHHAGLTGAIAALMALAARRRDGHGQIVDHSTVEVLASLHTAFFLPLFVYGGGIVGCRNGRIGAIPTYPNGVLPCRDGLVSVASPQLAQWLRFLELMGNPSWAELPRYRDRRAMALDYRDEVDALVIDWTSAHSKAELYDAFLSNRVPCAPVQDGPDLLANEHLAARQALVTHELADGVSVTMPRGPFRFGRSRIDPRPAPPAGGKGSAAVSTASFPAPGERDDRPPLAGLRVLDLGTAWAGGLAGRFLGDFGADVIKVESWSHMDGSRKGKPLLVDDAAAGDRGEWPNIQAGFHVHSRSKRSVALNLKLDEGRAVLMDLVRTVDVLIHNFPPRVAERLGLVDEALLAVNPRLVIGAQSVAGNAGPASGYIGYAGTVAALSGLLSNVGYEGEEPIAQFQGLYCDVISALACTLGLMAALTERAESGTGQSVDVSQWEATMMLAGETVVEASMERGGGASVGFAHPLLCPHGMYRCALPDGEDPESAWVSVAVGSDREWNRLVALLGKGSDLPTSAAAWSLEERRAHRAVIDAAIEAWTSVRDRYTAERELQGSGVAGAAVQSIADLLDDEQLLHRDAFVHLEHPLVGVEPMPGVPWRLTRTSGQVTVPAPSLGEHTREVLVGELGMGEATFERLVEIGAIEIGPVEIGPVDVVGAKPD